MPWPKWIRSKTWQWIIGIFIAILAIVIPLIISNQSPPDQQVKNIKGDNNIIVQVDDSPGASVVVSEIDAEKLARQLIKHLPDQKTLEDKEIEIKELKATIERLQKDPADKFKQAALQALNEGHINNALDLMVKAAESHMDQIEQLTKQTAQDWIDIGNIASLYDPQSALNAYQKAVEFDSSNPISLNKLGIILTRLGRLEEALQAYESSLKLASNDHHIQSDVYGNIGNVYRIRGDLDKALDMYEKSLAIDTELDHKEGMATDYGNMGIIYKIRGDLDKALDMHDKSLKIEKELGNKKGVVADYGNIGIIYRIRGDLDKALDMHEKSLKIAKELGYLEGIALNYGCIGNIYQKKGDLDKALDMYEKSLAINKELGHEEGMATNYNDMGTIYKDQGNLDKAMEMHEKALVIDNELSRKEGFALNYGNIGNIYQKKGDLDKALDMYEKSLAINKDLGRKLGMAIQYVNIGIVYQKQGNLDKACFFWTKSLALFQSTGAKNEASFVQKMMTESCDVGPSIIRQLD